ncbi:hypothetical protein [Rhodobacter ferrooxidans]|uniref:DUF3108 domain-containing protein n=1 Tax=Rhodobacter ferrooxidans TaxID=371731 RepID=C8RZ44_9RHOB|nr:hypothetical protein [Rhodobacter sp. SW2]EEW26001.1 hypothetical protein Rsw2DRAFT_1072 [Rhodobacter sp. SW2]
MSLFVKTLVVVIFMGTSVAQAAEGCLTRADLVNGIAVTTKDGRTHEVTAAANGQSVTVRYSWKTGRVTAASVMQYRNGRYLVSDTRSFSDRHRNRKFRLTRNMQGVVQRDQFRYVGSNFPDLATGVSWLAPVSIRHETTDATGAISESTDSTATAVYSGVDDQVVTVAGCAYRAVGIEVEYSGKSDRLIKRRQLYFPDLGFSVITASGPDSYGPADRNDVTGVYRLSQ